MSISCNQVMPARKESQGFSLIELMVALAVGLILIVGLMSLVVGNMQGYGELNKASYQVENARYSSQFLGDELAMAGYYGNLSFPGESADLPTNPCSVALDQVQSRFKIPVQGDDNVSSSGGELACGSGMNIKSGTDVLLLRRAATTAILPSAREADKLYLASNISRVDIVAGTSSVSSISYLADPLFSRVRRFYERVIFVSTCNVCTGSAADTIPTLKMIELLNGSWSAPVPLVEGVDELQVEYGLDTDSNGAADRWSPFPEATQWPQVMAIRFHLLMRNTEETRGYSDSKVYSVGLSAADTPRKVGPFLDSFKRHVYSMTVRLHNVAERWEN